MGRPEMSQEHPDLSKSNPKVTQHQTNSQTSLDPSLSLILFLSLSLPFSPSLPRFIVSSYRHDYSLSSVELRALRAHWHMDMVHHVPWPTPAARRAMVGSRQSRSPILEAVGCLDDADYRWLMMMMMMIMMIQMLKLFGGALQPAFLFRLWSSSFPTLAPKPKDQIYKVEYYMRKINTI